MYNKQNEPTQQLIYQIVLAFILTHNKSHIVHPIILIHNNDNKNDKTQPELVCSSRAGKQVVLGLYSHSQRTTHNAVPYCLHGTRDIYYTCIYASQLTTEAPNLARWRNPIFIFFPKFYESIDGCSRHSSKCWRHKIYPYRLVIPCSNSWP